MSNAKIEIIANVFMHLWSDSIVAKNVWAWRVLLTNRRNIVAAGHAAIAFRHVAGRLRSESGYSGMASPEPPNSAGKSFSFGRPSRIGSTVSA